MKTIQSLTICFALLASFFLCGCADNKGSNDNVEDLSATVSCVAVMPVRTAGNHDETLSFALAKQLENGGAVLNGILRNTLHGGRDYRFVSESFAESLNNTTADISEEDLMQAAEHVSCPAVLEVVLEEYSDRVGGKFSSQKPASAAFNYRLYDVAQKKTLCHGRFEETQQSLMENIYNLKKASSRGFLMITAEELLQEGVQNKFEQCPYLSE